MPEKLDTYRKIELAEGVEVQLRPAGVFPRLLARLIDLAIFSAAMFLLMLVFSLVGLAVGVEASEGMAMLVAFVLFWFYEPLCERSKWGGTPGKKALKLKVVKMSGAPVGFQSAFMRLLLLWIDLMPLFGAVGVVSILVSRNSQRLGDLLAGTLVIYAVPPPVSEAKAIASPPIAPGVVLQREEELAFLEFAGRFESLSAERRAEIAGPLAGMQEVEKAPNATSFAMGVARWLQKAEG
ncbi:MAG: RDD family protein [Verrucomicrobiota bacterium]